MYVQVYLVRIKLCQPYSRTKHKNCQINNELEVPIQILTKEIRLTSWPSKNFKIDIPYLLILIYEHAFIPVIGSY